MDLILNDINLVMTLALLVTRKKYINIYKLKKVYIYSYLEKISKTTEPKIILSDEANFSFDFGLIFAILRRFFATLHRF